MTNGQQHRQLLIAFTLAGVFFTICRFILDPTAGNRPVTPFTFPSVVPLPGWQPLESRPLVSPIASSSVDIHEADLTSRQYRYSSQNHQQMEIEMHYVAGTLGNFQGYLEGFSQIRWQSTLPQNLRHHEGVGFYSLFVHQGRSHLIACINPRGGSTVTNTQFLANRRTYDLQLQRIVPWLLGKESLLDRRCLWSHLSIPLHKASVDTRPVLEKAWWSWYQWWRSRFPQH